MKSIAIPTSMPSLLLLASVLTGCNGAGANATNGAGNSGGSGAPASTTVASLKAELGLKPDPVELEDAMEELETVWYEDAWTAMAENRLMDAARSLVHSAHLLSVAKPPAEHAADEQFTRWLRDVVPAVEEAATAAIAGDRQRLEALVNTIDEKRCVTCHKAYKKEK